LQAANQRDATSELVDFLEAIKKAEVEGEAALVGIIRNAAEKTWPPAAWLLERRHPDRWGKKIKSEVTAAPPRADMSPADRNIIEATRTAELTIALVLFHDILKLPSPLLRWG
jgi:hypothetical protein